MTDFFPWHKVKSWLANPYSTPPLEELSSSPLQPCSFHRAKGFEEAGNILRPFAISGSLLCHREKLSSLVTQSVISLTRGTAVTCSELERQNRRPIQIYCYIICILTSFPFEDVLEKCGSRSSRNHCLRP